MERGRVCRGRSRLARSPTSCSTRRWSTAMWSTQGYRTRVAGTSPSRWPRRIEPRRSAVLTIEGGAAAFLRRSHAHEGGASPCESQDDGAPLCCGALRGSLKAVACRLILGRSLDPIMHTPAIFYLTLLAAPLVGAAQNQAGMPVGSFAFTHVTVIDMTGAPPQSDMTVVVTGHRIARTEPRRPDTEGRTYTRRDRQVSHPGLVGHARPRGVVEYASDVRTFVPRQRRDRRAGNVGQPRPRSECPHSPRSAPPD